MSTVSTAQHQFPPHTSIRAPSVSAISCAQQSNTSQPATRYTRLPAAADSSSALAASSSSLKASPASLSGGTAKLALSEYHEGIDKAHTDTTADRRSLLAWKQYLQTAATADDIAISWRMFTSIAAHAAWQAVVNGIRLEELLDPALVNSGPLVSASQLCRFLCSRLENVSWRVWYERTQQKPSKNLPPQNQSAVDHLPARKFDGTLSHYSAVTASSSADTRGDIGGLRRSHSEPNLMAMSPPTKQQRHRAKEWLAGSLADALKHDGDSMIHRRPQPDILECHGVPLQPPAICDDEQVDEACFDAASVGTSSSGYTVTVSAWSETESASTESLSSSRAAAEYPPSAFSKCRFTSASTMPRHSLLSQLLHACPALSQRGNDTTGSGASAAVLHLDAAAARRRSVKQQESAQRSRRDDPSLAVPGKSTNQRSDTKVAAGNSTQAPIHSTPFRLPYCPGTPIPQTSSVLVITGSGGSVHGDHHDQPGMDQLASNSSPHSATHRCSDHHVLDRVHTSISSLQQQQRCSSRANSATLSEHSPQSDSLAVGDRRTKGGSAPSSQKQTVTPVRPSMQRSLSAASSSAEASVARKTSACGTDIRRFLDDTLAIW